MEYTQASNTVLGPRPNRRLDVISNYADRVERAAQLLTDFSGRFYGSQPTGSLPGDVISVSYGDNLSRLATALDRLESQLETLNEIG